MGHRTSACFNNDRARAWADRAAGCGRRGACGILLIVAVGVANDGAHAAGLLAEPSIVTFTSQDQTVAVTLTCDGTPLPADSIRGTRLLVGQHDYDEMIRVVKADGSLTITPTRFLEVGTYELEIGAAAGRTIVKVYAPLSDLPDTLQERADAAGVSLEELRRLLGLSTELPGKTVRIKLPPVYYEGQVMTLRMPPSADRHFMWAVNGEVVTEGKGRNEFAYVFPKPGNYVLTYSEKAGGATVASAVASTTVTTMPPLAWEVPVNVEVSVDGPEGFTEYLWHVDGELVATGRSFKHTFSKTGQANLECLASEPKAGPPGHFIRVVYGVSVVASPSR